MIQRGKIPLFLLHNRYQSLIYGNYSWFATTSFKASFGSAKLLGLMILSNASCTSASISVQPSAMKLAVALANNRRLYGELRFHIPCDIFHLVLVLRELSLYLPTNHLPNIRPIFPSKQPPKFRFCQFYILPSRCNFSTITINSIVICIRQWSR